MKRKQVNILLRLIVILGGLGFIFWALLQIPSLFRFNDSTYRHIRHKTFGIEIPSGYKVHGIDVSRHQGIIDWSLVDSMKSGGIEISFAFLKATEGITRQDPNFKRNWRAVGKTNLLRGAYHFYYPSRDASKQAQNFIKNVKLSKGDLPPVVDIEHTNRKSKKQICEGLTVFLSLLEDHYKVKPIIYTNHSFYSDYLQGEFDEYPLWISYYTDKKTFNSACKYPWIIWQHSERGKIDGINGKVDFNVFSGDLQRLRKLSLQ